MARILAACLLIGSTLAACRSRDGDHGPPRVAWDLRLPLSKADNAYLDSLPVLRVGVDPQWAPMAFVDQRGRIDGISADYLDFLQDTLHLRFRLVPTRSWGETLQLASEGRIDIVVAASSTGELAPGFGLSTPYVRYPLVIVTRETAPFIAGLDDLEGAQVAVVGDSRFARVRTANLTGLHKVMVDSAEDGLKAVAGGRAFAYIGNLGVVDRIVRERYAGTLRVAAPVDRIQDLSFGIAPRYAPLLPLIDRVLAAVPETEREHIQNSWLSSRFTFGVAPRTLWLVLSPVGTLTLVFLGVLGFNTARLRKEVRERRRTEHELVIEQAALILAKHDAEAATRARESFIATISHEIRTPMSGVVGMLQLLDHDGLAADDRQLVEMAGNAAELSLRILNDILDYAKSENGELSLESAPMSLEEIVRRSVAVVEPDIGRKGLLLNVDVSKNVAPNHVGDAQRLGQVLLNLLGNAVKFTDAGSVSVTAGVLADRAEEQVVSISVADTGIGIAPEEQAGLFTPFSQAQSLPASRYGGTGLGLAICKRLIEQMGGQITLRSDLGRGTEVKIALTLRMARDALRARCTHEQHDQCDLRDPLDVPSTEAAAPATSAPRILLVEDQSINREVLRRQLAGLNVTNCDIAVDGAEALSAYERNTYAAVITDCTMPGLSGVELMSCIRQRERGSNRHTVLIAVTADATQRQRNACLDAGADEFCIKPLALERLRELLDRYGLVDVPFPALEKTDVPVEEHDALRLELRWTLTSEMKALLGLSLTEDREQARDIAHSIAGTAAWFQLRDVAEEATRLERSLEAGEVREEALPALKSAIERAVGGTAF
ncbi:response regulator [Trinickia dinghuensis]|uniref:Virulence sensor protein BvgS n=1 Tax=Trinickia dinghuensis TaxID=2291023 RepID=A0A3D8JV52_9BURK|nr:response regulator [Trinickia dinghuensis]